MNEVDIDGLRSLVSTGKIIWTEHLAIRLRERGIKRDDVISCVGNGEIIEQYPDDMPYPSCLINGKSASEKPLHIVCAHNTGESCCVITAYYPDPDKWENDNKTRKVKD